MEIYSRKNIQLGSLKERLGLRPEGGLFKEILRLKGLAGGREEDFNYLDLSQVSISWAVHGTPSK
jgi:hypothetical protein